MARNVTEIQRKLIALGYLHANGDDGKFGHMSLDAYNRFRASIGKGPVVQTSMAELNADLFPEDQPKPPPKPPKSNPLQDWLLSLAIKKGASYLKGLPMFAGYKTYATAFVIAVMGLYSMFFGELPLVGANVDPGSAFMALLSALGLVFGRAGAKADVKKIE